MQEVDCICYDADYTLVNYNYHNMWLLEYESICQVLVQDKGYPSIISTAPWVPLNFHKYCQQGVIIDLKTSYIIKIDQNQKITQAIHGIDPIPTETLRQVYGEDLYYELTQKEVIYIKGNRWIMQTSFTMGHLLTYLTCIEYKKRGEMQWLSIEQLAVDLYDAVLNQFCQDTGLTYFGQRIRDDPSRYIQNQPDLPDMLLRIREKGVKQVLITNSAEQYGDVIMRATLGDNWTTYFDKVILFAWKPSFFISDREYQELTGFPDNVSKGGNAKILLEELGCRNPVIVGDHYISDMYAKPYGQWKTILISENVYFEKDVDQLVTPQEILRLPMKAQNPSDTLEIWGSHFGSMENRSFWMQHVEETVDLVSKDFRSALIYLLDLL